MTAKVAVIPHQPREKREQNFSSGPPIAIVDDEESVRNAFARLMRAYSFQTQTYGSGTEFLESLGNNVPACLIVDLHLGDMSGFDLLRRLTGAGMNIPAIIVTARNDPGLQNDFALRRVVTLLTKPVDVNSLLSAIVTAMTTSRGRDANGRSR